MSDSQSSIRITSQGDIHLLQVGKGRDRISFKLNYPAFNYKKLVRVSPCCGENYGHSKGTTSEGKNFRCSGCGKISVYPHSASQKFKLNMDSVDSGKLDRYFSFWLSERGDVLERILLVQELIVTVDGLTLPVRQRRDDEHREAEARVREYQAEDARIHKGESICPICEKYIPLENKGKSTPPNEDHSSVYCDGAVTLATNPFAVEVHGDYTKSWSCSGQRYESAMDA
jgi:hypothetical protein